AGLPTFRGTWYFIGPFDNTDNKGFDAVYPPEKEIDLKKTYPGKNNETAAWKEFPKFRVGEINNLKFWKNNDNSVIYLYREFDAPEAMALPISLGSDDSLAVWLNGENLVSQNVVRSAAPDQDHATLKLKAGKNQLL